MSHEGKKVWKRKAEELEEERKHYIGNPNVETIEKNELL